MAQPIQNHHHYHQSNQLQQPVVYSPTPLVAQSHQGHHMTSPGWAGQPQGMIGGGGGYQNLYQTQQEYQNRLLIEAGEVQRRYSCLKSSGGSSAGSTSSQHGIKASGSRSENAGGFKAEQNVGSPSVNVGKVVL